MKKIALLGVYGINNTGDNLEALATKSLLEKQLLQAEIKSFSVSFSPMARTLLGEQRKGRLECDTLSADLTQKEFWESVSEFDALIIGGGGLLAPIPEFEPLLFSGAHIQPGRLPKTAWNAIGSIWAPLADRKLSEWYLKIKRATEIVDYISIRSLTTQRLLEHVGCPPERINLVPSLVTALTIESVEPIVDEFLSRYNIQSCKPLIGVSVGPELMRPPLKDFMGELAKALGQVKNVIPKDGKILIFPVGEMYEDAAACKILSDLCPDALLVKENLTPTQIWGIIGKLDAYLSMRYHSIISAIAQGIPTLSLDCYLGNDSLGSKLRDLIWQSGLEQSYFSPIIEICGDPQYRSFAKIPQINNISKRLFERVIDLLVTQSKKQWMEASNNEKTKALNHLDMMIQALKLN
jgi:polysaccharide pyruvyl transferase WcaK-like protein